MTLYAVTAAVLGALAIWGKHEQRMLVHYLAKPLTLLVIIAAAALHPSLLPPAAKVALLVALALSLAGDVLLMFGQRYFSGGLMSFLAAHVAFVVAFALEAPPRLADLGWLAPPLLAGVLVVRGLWPHLGAHRLAVAVYVVALAAVAWRLLARAALLPELGVMTYGLGVLGGALFMLSDALLARRRFVRAAAPYAVELGSYFLAQALIVAATW